MIAGVKGATHRALGTVLGLGYGTAAGLPIAGVIGCGLLAPLTAAGPLSPDIDLQRSWRLTDRSTPDELLGRRGPLQHRGITHWWGLALAVTLLWWTALAPLADGGRGSLLAHGAGALLAGWWSHLAGDLVFGRADVRSGRGPGIPVMPWWAHVGVTLRVGGALERAALVASWLVAAAQVFASLGLLDRVSPTAR